MRHLFLTACAISVVATAANTQEVGLTDTISGQFDAFQSEDFEAAFEFASPTIQRQLQSPDRFESMLRNVFPMMLGMPEITFLDQRPRPPFTWQLVKIIDENGGKYLFAYEMIKVGEEWRINAVYPLTEPDLAA